MSQDAYDVIDEFLRNNLDDDDYAQYSKALDELVSQPVVAQPEAIIKLQDALIVMLDRFDRPNNLFSQRMACNKARLALSNTESK